MKTRQLLSLVVVGGLLLATPPLAARPWQGAEPGVSTKPEVIKQFGEPHRMLTGQKKCATLLNYQATQKIRGTKQVNFCFDDKNVLKEISVFPDRSLTRELVEQAYGEKYVKKLTDDFREYYYYKADAMAVFWDKEGKTVESMLFSTPKK